MEENGHQAKARVNLSSQEIKEVTLKLKHIIQQGRLGYDYTLKRSNKNQKLKSEYYITDKKILDILMDLDADNFIKAEYSDNIKFPNDIMYIYKKSVYLVVIMESDNESIKIEENRKWKMEEKMEEII